MSEAEECMVISIEKELHRANPESVRERAKEAMANKKNEQT